MSRGRETGPKVPRVVGSRTSMSPFGRRSFLAVPLRPCLPSFLPRLLPLRPARFGPRPGRPVARVCLSLKRILWTLWDSFQTPAAPLFGCLTKMFSPLNGRRGLHQRRIRAQVRSSKGSPPSPTRRHRPADRRVRAREFGQTSRRLVRYPSNYRPHPPRTTRHSPPAIALQADRRGCDRSGGAFRGRPVARSDRRALPGRPDDRGKCAARIGRATTPTTRTGRIAIPRQARPAERAELRIGPVRPYRSEPGRSKVG